MSGELLRELAYVKAVFQLRTLEAIIRGPEYPSVRVHRRKVQSVAAAMREELGLPPSPALSPDRSHRRAQIRGRG